MSKHTATIASLISLFFVSGSSAADTQKAPNSLRVATWNVEHLAYPIDRGCRPRTEQEIADMKAYADNLHADIVGLQEVGSKEAVNLLFPERDWHIVMSTRKDNEPFECRDNGNPSTQQKVAFAVRKDLSLDSVKGLADFGLEREGLRYGLQIQVSDNSNQYTLLNVHLKSGCFVDNYSRSDRESCETFAKQAPILDQWIDDQEATGKPYMILGDFNHRLTAPYNHLTRQILRDDNGNRNSLINTHAETIGCHPYYPAPIDLIFAGNMPETVWSFKPMVATFKNMEVDAMLSDHCAIVTEFAQSAL
ncbi:endonuclease/exonuclease/phosphatase family protein [Alteromonas sediminis]|nr:endonuclease/exonuclease/phosphatase family protein [Alteromonas sediminis]